MKKHARRFETPPAPGLTLQDYGRYASHLVLSQIPDAETIKRLDEQGDLRWFEEPVKGERLTRRHMLEGTMKAARGWHTPPGDTAHDVFVHHTQGVVRDVKKYDKTQKTEHGYIPNRAYEIVGQYHQIALQGAYRSFAPRVNQFAPDAINRFQFQGDVVGGEAVYDGHYQAAAEPYVALSGATAWRQAIMHLSDIRGMLNLQDPAASGRAPSHEAVDYAVRDYIARQPR